MGSSNLEYFNGSWKGSLSDTQCMALDRILEKNEEQGCEPALLHIIYNMSDSDVLSLIEEYDEYGYLISEFERPRGELRPYQTLGVAFAFRAGNMILGDSVGLGKTVQTAGLCNLMTTDYANKGKDFRYLVLTEKNLAKQFRQELVKFTGEYVGLIPSGEKKDLDDFIYNHPYDEKLDVSVVGTHSLLTASKFLVWLERCRREGEGFPFDMLVVDESSCLGGKSTNQIVKAYKQLAKYFKKILFLNATPFERKMEVFYNQLNLLDSKLVPTKGAFQKEYCVMRFNGAYTIPTGRYKNESRFRNNVKYHYFARTRRENGAVMEDCKGGILYSPLSKVQKELLKKSMLNRVIYDCPCHVDPTVEFNSENVPKLESLKDVLDNKCSADEPVLIYTYHKKTQSCLSDWLDMRGITNRVLNGETSNKDRDTIIKGFKNKEYRILITNVQKGLNFGDCNFCIFYSFDPNPSSMVQFEGRTTRSFDIIGKNVYILCSDGDEKKTLEKVVKERAQSAGKATNMDLSVVLSLLLGGDSDEDNSKD